MPNIWAWVSVAMCSVGLAAAAAEAAPRARGPKTGSTVCLRYPGDALPPFERTAAEDYSEARIVASADGEAIAMSDQVGRVVVWSRREPGRPRQFPSYGEVEVLTSHGGLYLRREERLFRVDTETGNEGMYSEKTPCPSPSGVASVRGDDSGRFVAVARHVDEKARHWELLSIDDQAVARLVRSREEGCAAAEDKTGPTATKVIYSAEIPIADAEVTKDHAWIVEGSPGTTRSLVELAAPRREVLSRLVGGHGWAVTLEGSLLEWDSGDARLGISTKRGRHDINVRPSAPPNEHCLSIAALGYGLAAVKESCLEPGESQWHVIDVKAERIVWSAPVRSGGIGVGPDRTVMIPERRGLCLYALREVRPN